VDLEYIDTLHEVWARWSYIWAQKKNTFERKQIHDWAHFTLAIYLRKKNKIIKLLRNYNKNDL
jgi:hypothetical protein